MDEETKRRARERHAEKLAAEAPPLSPEQRATLYALLFQPPPPKGVQKPPNLIYSKNGTDDVRQSMTLDLRALGVDPLGPDAPLEDQAQACWKVARHLAMTTGGLAGAQKRHTRHGWVGRFAMSDVHLQVLGGAGSSAEQLKRRGALINQVLRKTQVAECLAHPKGSTPTWWVSDALPWDTLVAVVAHVRGGSAAVTSRLELDAMTYAERQVTPDEAGETRAPAPVATTEKKKTRGWRSQQVKDAFEDRTRRAREAGEFAYEAVLDVVRSAEQPMTLFEVAWLVADITGQMKPDVTQHVRQRGAMTSTRTRLNELEAAGKVASRVETKAERNVRYVGGRGMARRGKLWWHSKPVPPRTKGQLVPEIPLYGGQAPGPKKKQQPAPPPVTVEAGTNDEQRVLDAIVAANRGLYVSGHSSHSLPYFLPDIPLERIRVAADHLHRRGVLLKNESRYMLEAWRGRLGANARPNPPQAPDTAPLPAYVNDAPAAPAEAHTEAPEPPTTTLPGEAAFADWPPEAQAAYAHVVEAAEALARLTAQPADSVDAELLRDEVLRLEEENGKLRQQVSGLRQALAAME